MPYVPSLGPRPIPYSAPIGAGAMRTASIPANGIPRNPSGAGTVWTPDANTANNISQFFRRLTGAKPPPPTPSPMPYTPPPIQPTPFRPRGPVSAAGSGYRIRAPYGNAAGGVNRAYTPSTYEGPTYWGSGPSQSTQAAWSKSYTLPSGAAKTAAVTSAATEAVTSVAGAAAGALAAPAAIVGLVGLGLALLPHPSPEQQQENWNKLPASYKKQYCEFNPKDPKCQSAPPNVPPEAVAGGAIGSTTQIVEVPASFTGGQCAAVYNVSGTFTVTDGGGSSNYGPQEIQGPIGGFRLTSFTYSSGNIGWSLQAKGGNGSWVELAGRTGGPNATASYTKTFQRADGGEDNCGNATQQVEQPATSGNITRQEIASPGFSVPNFKLEPPAIKIPSLHTPSSSLPELPKEPIPAGALPEGHPLVAPPVQAPSPTPTWQPQINPDGTPTGNPAPEATPTNVPSPSPQKQAATLTAPNGNPVSDPIITIGGQKFKLTPQGAIALGTGAAIATSLLKPIPLSASGGNKIKDPTKPGDFLEPSPTPLFIPTIPASGGCGCNAPIMNKMDDLDRKVSNLAGGAGEAISTATIMAKLTQMQTFAEKAWDSTRLQKVIDVLTLATSLHNAYYLSSDVAQTFGEMLNLVLESVGIKDEAGNPLDVNSIVGNAVKTKIHDALGDRLYTSVTNTLTKASRIYQSASNVIWNLRSLQDSVTDLLEITANNTGKIGNALKLSRVVDALSYPYFSENYKASDTTRRKMQRILDGIEQADDTVGTLYAAVASVRDVQEEITQVGQAKQQLQTDIGQLEPATTPENQPKATAAAAGVAASQSPPVTPSDLNPANATP